MIDPVEFGKQMGAIVRDATAPLLARIAALEARSLERGEKGDPGAAGERGPQGVPGSAGEKGERGEQGIPGRDGKDADPIDLKDVIAELAVAPEIKTVLTLLVAEAVQEAVTKVLPAAVEAYVKANPPKDGRDGKDGRDAEPAKPGEKGEPGRDGVGMAGALIDRDGVLTITMTDGTTRSLGVVVGRDGKDGKDGLSMADVTREYDAATHEVVERWSTAGLAKELRYPAGGLRPGGFWREGLKCHALQAITHDGALWIAKRDTCAKPCLEHADDWQLACRKGRDGRDGKDGRDLAPPPPVKLDD